MLALLGFPIFGGAGFFAKWYVLQAALQAPVPQTTLAVVLVLTTVVSAGYYLYVVMVMFMQPRADGRAGGPGDAGGSRRWSSPSASRRSSIFGVHAGPARCGSRRDAVAGAAVHAAARRRAAARPTVAATR